MAAIPPCAPRSKRRCRAIRMLRTTHLTRRLDGTFRTILANGGRTNLAGTIRRREGNRRPPSLTSSFKSQSATTPQRMAETTRAWGFDYALPPCRRSLRPPYDNPITWIKRLLMQENGAPACYGSVPCVPPRSARDMSWCTARCQVC